VCTKDIMPACHDATKQATVMTASTSLCCRGGLAQETYLSDFAAPEGEQFADATARSFAWWI